MRLDNKEKNAITSAILQSDPEAKIYLFGSRTDDLKKGGDIDILIISNNLSSNDKIPILRRIFELIDEQKIDLIIAKDTSDPFVQLAFNTAIKL